MTLIKYFGLLLLASLATGCLMAGNYHSAKTLNKGESSTGLTFSATSYEFVDRDQTDGDQTVEVTIPNILPEVTYSVGLQDNLEIGGRIGVGSLGAELNLKYRFLQSPNLHLAVAPSVGAQTLIVISGTSFKLPLLATFELSDNIAINAAAFGSATYYSGPEDDDDDSDFEAFSGKLAGAGAALGIEFSGETFAIRPGVEFTRYQFNVDDEDFDGFNTVNFLIHLSFIRGREKQQLDRIERKLDALSGDQ